MASVPKKVPGPPWDFGNLGSPSPSFRPRFAYQIRNLNVISISSCAISTMSKSNQGYQRERAIFSGYFKAPFDS